MRMNARLYSETKRNSRIQMDEKILLKVREVIEATGLSRSQVYFMIATGELPAIRCGRAIRVPTQLLKAWIERKVTQAINDQNQ